MVAILVHAFLPSPGATTNPDAFDGYLVQLFGFPFVASMYFVLLYLHIMILFFYFAERSVSKRIDVGLSWGIAFGLMYLIGMQEVVVEGSPLQFYGWDFISYQFFMGLGDTIPVLVLCLILTLCIKKKDGKKIKERIHKDEIIRLVIIAVCFFAERTVGYYLGYVGSDIRQYPLPVLLWTLLMGFVFGIMNLLLNRVHPETTSRDKNIQINVLCIGINWIWFNCFMGLILKDTFLKMLLRGGVDVVFFVLGTITADLITRDKTKILDNKK